MHRLLALLLAAGSAYAELRAGAASRIITPDLAKYRPVYLAGFGHNRRATMVHDDLYVRCLAIQPARNPLVICGVDSIGLFWDDVERIRKAVNANLVVPADVIVASLHDHQAPDTMGLWGSSATSTGLNEDYNNYIVDETAQAAIEAALHMKPANISLAKTHPPELDTFIADNRPPDVHDSELVLMSVNLKNGKPIATLVNWANHPETLGSKNTKITADYPAALYRRLEEQRGGMAVFINGAVGGMQSPLGAKFDGIEDNSFEKADHIGKRVAEIAASALEQAKPVRITSYEFSEKMVKIPVTNQGFEEADRADIYHGRKSIVDGETSTPVGVVRLLDGSDPMLEIALIPGELYPELSVGGIQKYAGADFPDAPAEPAIKNMMKAPYRMLFGLADDEIGYIIPKSEWDNQEPWLQNAPKRWYGEENSVGPDCAPIITRTIQELLNAK